VNHLCVRVAGLVVAGLLAWAGPGVAGDSWKQFRGSDGQGHSDATGLPLEWSETRNVTWKVPISGAGYSSPVIQGEQIWLTTARDMGRAFFALCRDKKTGNVVHDLLVVANDMPGKVHRTNSPASPTPILEGDRVYVHFGDNGTACLKTDGKIVWKKTLPHAQGYGPSSSPVLYKDLLIVPCHGTDVAYLVALDKDTGDQRWRLDHQGRCSESTALIIPTESGDQLVYNAAERVVSVNPLDGREIWSVAQGNNFAQIPRPVYGHGMVYVCGGYFDPVVHAIKPGGSEDVTKTHVTWTVRHASVPYNPSPLLIGKEFFMISDAGIASCHDALAGKLHFRKRVEGTYYASPISAEGRIYLFNDAGKTTVIKPGVEFEVLATNLLEGKIMATPAIVDRAMYLRTDTHLYRLEESPSGEK
jgi:outer membrane protein assembly factor BamB